MKLTDIFFPYQKKFFFNQKKRKIWISSRQVGKSFTIGGELVYKALSKKNGLALCISTGARAAAEVIRKCTQFAEAVKVATKGMIDYSTTFDSVKFSNGCRVLSLPASTDGANLRGFTATAVCIDEAAFVMHFEQIMQALGPTLSRDKDADLILTTTPAGKNGPFYELYQMALGSDDWYVQTTTIHDAIADGLDVDLSSLKTLCPDPSVFAQEYECQFLSEYSSMIDLNYIDWYEEIPEGVAKCFLGMDIGSKSDKSAAIVIKRIDDIDYVDDIVVMDKMSYEDQLEVVKHMHDKHRFIAGYIDETGIGSAFAEFCTKKVSSQLKGLTFTSSNKTPMYEALRSGIFEHKTKFNSKFKSKIMQDFQNVSRIVTESGQVKYQAGRDENGHSDITSGIVLALKASHDNPTRTSMPFSVKSSGFYQHMPRVF